jgi:hypothetical protein
MAAVILGEASKAAEVRGLSLSECVEHTGRTFVYGFWTVPHIG